MLVTATYLIPHRVATLAAAPSDDEVGAKICDSAVSLKYGDREAYVNGIDKLIASPLLTLEREFSRDISWTDWKGVRYSVREEWAYVTGTARVQPGCTPGTRDSNNDGRSPEDFLRMGNELIRSRRETGTGTMLPDTHAFLTLNEVLAIRLYSGSAYQPINNFLRQVSAVSGNFRAALAQAYAHFHPSVTTGGVTAEDDAYAYVTIAHVTTAYATCAYATSSPCTSAPRRTPTSRSPQPCDISAARSGSWRRTRRPRRQRRDSTAGCVGSLEATSGASITWGWSSRSTWPS